MSVFEAADRICEEISRKQAICSDDTVLKCVDGAAHDSNTGHRLSQLLNQKPGW